MIIENNETESSDTERNADFVAFWDIYTKKFLKILIRSRYEMNDAPVRFFVRRQSFPPEAIIEQMYPDKNPLSIHSEKCTLFHQCLPINGDKSTLLDDNHVNIKPCIAVESLSECPQNTTAFEVIRIRSRVTIKYLVI